MIDELGNSELYNLEHTIDKLIKNFPNARKKLVNECGRKLYDKVRENIQRDVKQNTGNLLKGVEIVIGSGGGYAAIRANNYIAPHTHLVENGHRAIKGKKLTAREKRRGIPDRQKDVGWVDGKHMYRNALNDLIFELENDAEEFIEKVVGEAFG